MILIEKNESNFSNARWDTKSKKMIAEDILCIAAT